MQLTFKTVYLRKKIPLAISRGTSPGSHNLFVGVTVDGVTGWGEMAPVSRGAMDAESGRAALEEFVAGADFGDAGIVEIHDRANPPGPLYQGGAKGNPPGRLYQGEGEKQSPHPPLSRGGEKQSPRPPLSRGGKSVPACALAALDIALWDVLARRAGLPLYRLLGLGKPRAPTSITLGICTPEEVRERLPQLLAGNRFRALKVKLGSRHGTDADQAMFAAVAEGLREYPPMKVRVDANGGWDVSQAKRMMRWLAARDVEYVEQPLPATLDAELPALYQGRPLPIFVDESCHFAADIPAFAHAVDGVNLKLMKCGGITEAMRIIAVARALKLQTMIGCMNESSLSISAGAALGAALDYIDLDSQFNLDPDPCAGAELADGVVMPPESPGHGAFLTHP